MSLNPDPEFEYSPLLDPTKKKYAWWVMEFLTCRHKISQISIRNLTCFILGPIFNFVNRCRNIHLTFTKFEFSGTIVTPKILYEY